MRKPMTLAQHGNSVRLTFPPPSLRWLHWGQGTEVMFEIVSPYEVRIVELEHYMREHVARERAEHDAAARAGQPIIIGRRDTDRAPELPGFSPEQRPAFGRRASDRDDRREPLLTSGRGDVERVEPANVAPRPIEPAGDEPVGDRVNGARGERVEPEPALR